MLSRYYVYAPDRTEHPYIFAPESQMASLKSKPFEHAIVDCGYNVLMKEKEYSPEFFERYIGKIRKNRELFGKEKIWFVPPDYPCERDILGFKESIRERVDKTIDSVIRFFDMNIDVQWLIPLQGWNLEDYVYCIEKYNEAGIGLDIAAVGTVCKRKKREPIVKILRGIRNELSSSWIHAFGLTKKYLRDVFYSIDSFDTASYTWGRFKYLNDPKRPERWNYPDFLFNEWKKDVDEVMSVLSLQQKLSQFTNKGEDE